MRFASVRQPYLPLRPTSVRARSTPSSPTERVLNGLMGAGFVPVDARQTQARRSSPSHARHILRLRRRFEIIELKDAIPEIVFLNSHDGTSAYIMLT